RAGGVANVLRKALPPTPAPHFGAGDFDRRAVAEFAPGAEARIGGAGAAVAELALAQFHVQAHFLIEILAVFGAVKQVLQTSQQVHETSVAPAILCRR